MERGARTRTCVGIDNNNNKNKKRTTGLKLLMIEGAAGRAELQGFVRGNGVGFSGCCGLILNCDLSEVARNWETWKKLALGEQASNSCDLPVARAFAVLVHSMYFPSLFAGLRTPRPRQKLRRVALGPCTSIINIMLLVVCCTAMHISSLQQAGYRSFVVRYLSPVTCLVRCTQYSVPTIASPS